MNICCLIGNLALEFFLTKQYFNGATIEFISALRRITSVMTGHSGEERLKKVMSTYKTVFELAKFFHLGGYCSMTRKDFFLSSCSFTIYKYTFFVEWHYSQIC